VCNNLCTCCDHIRIDGWFDLHCTVDSGSHDSERNGCMNDAHIELNGYPFLDNKQECNLTTTVDVMRPRLMSSLSRVRSSALSSR
jgi:hypothetical protein